jgi:hypothetical protein
MKKFLLGVAMMIGFLSFSYAQTVTPSKSENKKMPARHVTTTQAVAKKPVAATAPAVKTTTTTKKMSTVQPATSTAPVVVKKEGITDKRHIRRAHAKKGLLKKDGTPDMRYKKNKKS